MHCPCQLNGLGVLPAAAEQYLGKAAAIADKVDRAALADPALLARLDAEAASFGLGDYQGVRAKLGADINKARSMSGAEGEAFAKSVFEAWNKLQIKFGIGGGTNWGIIGAIAGIVVVGWYLRQSEG